MTLHDLWVSLALLAVIEGLAYALFPRGVKNIMAQMSSLPEDAMRSVGLVFATIGVAILWLLIRL